MLETVEARVRAAAPATAAPAEEPAASATAAGFGSSAGLKPSAGAETSLRDARSAGVEPWLPQRAWVAERPSAPSERRSRSRNFNDREHRCHPRAPPASEAARTEVADPASFPA